MEILNLDLTAGLPVERFDSTRARHLPVGRLSGSGAIGLIRLEALGVLGRHPAVIDQLFVVIEGSGWVSGPDGQRIDVTAGQAVVWREGEEHESGTNTAMTAIVVEAHSIEAHERHANAGGADGFSSPPAE